MLGGQAECRDRAERDSGERVHTFMAPQGMQRIEKGQREIVAVRFGCLMKGIYQHSCGQNIAAYFMFASRDFFLSFSLSTDFYPSSFLFRFGERIKFAQVLKLLGKDLHAKE